MRKLAVIVMILGLLCFTGLASAQFAKVGSAGIQFLKIGVGARALGMGETFVAISDDATSLFWNPGGISRIENMEATAAYTKWVADIDLTSAGIVKNFGTLGTFGLSFMALTTGYMNVRTVDRVMGTGEVFQFSDYMVGLSYGRNLTDRFSIGVTMKGVKESLGSVDDARVLFDLGTVYDVGYRDVRLGMSIMHFGPNFRYEVDNDNDGGIDEDWRDGYDNDGDGLTDEDMAEEDVPPPLSFRFGASLPLYRDESNSVVGSFELVHLNDNIERYNAGFEYSFQDMIYVRGGYKTNMDAGGLAAGAGIKLDVMDLGRLMVDYAVTDYGDLGLIHRGSINVAF